LKRLLQGEGISFRELVMQYQRDQAFDYLRDERLSIADIATRLGFSDSSSFSQSFKRWAGEAPLHFRRSLPHRSKGPA
jgi:AraC-like DNA-binding protein